LLVTVFIKHGGMLGESFCILRVEHTSLFNYCLYQIPTYISSERKNKQIACISLLYIIYYVYTRHVYRNIYIIRFHQIAIIKCSNEIQYLYLYDIHLVYRILSFEKKN